MLKTKALALSTICCLLALSYSHSRYHSSNKSIRVSELKLPRSDDVKITKISRSEAPLDRQKTLPSALLFHGYQCNKRMFTQLAKSLAANGISAYLFDINGHGHSKKLFEPETWVDSLSKEVDSLIKFEKIELEKLVLIGHSLGAKQVIEYGVQNPQVKSSILLGPAYLKGSSKNLPHNLLILEAEHEKPFIKDFTDKIYKEALQSENYKKETLYGGFQTDTSRLYTVIPNTDHMGLLFNKEAFSTISKWIESSFKLTLSPTVRNSPKFFSESRAVTTLSIASVILLMLTISTIASRSFSIETLLPEGELAIALLLMFASLVVGAMPFAIGVPLRLLGLEEGDVLASFICTTGVAAILFLGVFLRKKLRFPQLQSIAKTFGIAFFFFALTYGSSLVYLDQEFYLVSFTGRFERFAKFLLIALCIFPFFIATEATFRGIQRALRQELAGFAGSITIATVFFFSFYLSFSLLGLPLQRFAIQLVALHFCLQCLSAFIFMCSKNYLIGSVFQTLTISWIISIGFLLH